MLGWLLLPKRSVFVGGLALHRGLRPQAPDGFGLNPSSQLVLRYHWLAFLNQVRVSPTKKCSFLFKSAQIFRKDTQCSETDFLVHEFFLCDFLFLMYGLFCIWLILMYLTLYIKIDKPQKLKVAQEKLIN